MGSEMCIRDSNVFVFSVFNDIVVEINLRKPTNKSAFRCTSEVTRTNAVSNRQHDLGIFAYSFSLLKLEKDFSKRSSVVSEVK